MDRDYYAPFLDNVIAGKIMARVACIMMQKDEGELLRAWIEYYSALFGRFNLFIFDNASQDDSTKKILDKYQDNGLSINRMHTSIESHVRKDRIFGDLIRELDAWGHFDFTIPVDCDEFLVIRTEDGKISAQPSDIHSGLRELEGENKALGIDTSYYNILGKVDEFFCWSQKKTFFRGGSFDWMDSGFHDGKSKFAEGKKQTRFAHVHYHHKPYDILVAHSKNKLRPYFDPDDPEKLRDPANKNRLTDFLLQGENAYMNKFKTDGIKIQSIVDRFNSLGVRVPFS